MASRQGQSEDRIIPGFALEQYEKQELHLESF